MNKYRLIFISLQLVFFSVSGTNYLYGKSGDSGSDPTIKPKATCLLDFIAADKYLAVEYTTACNLDSLTGTGTYPYNSSGGTVKVSFSNIKVGREGVQYYLQSGTVFGEVDKEPIELTPEDKTNEKAYFYPDSVKITRYDYYIKGIVEYMMPDPMDLEDTLQISFKSGWVRFDDFVLLGRLNLADNQAIVIDSVNQKSINFTEESYIFIRGSNSFLLDTYPQLINKSDTIQIGTKHPTFTYFEYYHIQENIDEFALYGAYTLLVDLSYKTSPDGKDPNWMGMRKKDNYIEFNEQLTGLNKHMIELQNDTLGYIDIEDFNSIRGGRTDNVFDDKEVSYFRGFKCQLDSFSFSDPYNPKESYIKGKLNIPYISEELMLPFTFYSLDSIVLDTNVKGVHFGELNDNSITKFGIYIGDSLWLAQNDTINLPDTLDVENEFLVYFETYAIQIEDYASRKNIIRDETKISFDVSSGSWDSKNGENYWRFNTKAPNGDEKYNRVFISFYEVPEIVSVDETKRTREKVSIYPTVTSNRINLKYSESDHVSQNYRIEIISLSGQTVFDEVYNYIPDQIDISSLSQGVFILKVYVDEKEINHSKIIKN